MTRRVVITGVGAVTPLGIGSDPLIDRWIAGESGIEDGFGRCLDFEPIDFLSKKEARRADRFAQMAIVAGDEAVKQAFGEEVELPYDPYRVGCVIATGIGGLVSLEREQEKLILKGPKAVSPLAVPLMMGNAAAAAVSMRHGLQGHTLRGLLGLRGGQQRDRRRRPDHPATATPTRWSPAAPRPASPASPPRPSRRWKRPRPRGISRPFDARRDGFVMGEGAGVLVLEEKEAAEKRGATILGEVHRLRRHRRRLPPDRAAARGRGGGEGDQFALADAGITAVDVDYVNAHGTSTPLNDAAETKAIKAALGERAADIPVSSTKSVDRPPARRRRRGRGDRHDRSPAGVARLPRPSGMEEAEEGLDLDYVEGSAKPIVNGDGPVVAISNSFGFGGHNAVLVLTAN